MRNATTLEEGGSKKGVAHVVKDFKKFYESIRHDELEAKLRKRKFRGTLARAIRGAYSIIEAVDLHKRHLQR